MSNRETNKRILRVFGWLFAALFFIVLIGAVGWKGLIVLAIFVLIVVGRMARHRAIMQTRDAVRDQRQQP